MDIVDYAKQFVGVQETAGANRGPLVDRWKAEVSKGLWDDAIPWCAAFGFAMLSEVSGLDKAGLAKALGFDAKTWFPESTRSWLDQAEKAERVTLDPVRGDFFLLLKPSLSGGFTRLPHHLGILAQDGVPPVGHLIDTVEGNTVPGNVAGLLGREGNGVYARTRTMRAGEFVWISIPQELKVQNTAKKEEVQA